MKPSKKQNLRKAGWKIGTAAEFLELTAEEDALVTMKVALVQGVCSLRARHGLTQSELADRLGSSQSRIAKLEAGDRTVSFELLVRALLSLGAGPKQIAALLGTTVRTRQPPRRRRAA